VGAITRAPRDEGSILASSCEEPATANGPFILAATVLGSSMVFIDGTVVNEGLPALQSAQGATIAQVQWVAESYALFLAALLLMAAPWETAGSRRHAGPRRFDLFFRAVVLSFDSNLFRGLG